MEKPLRAVSVSETFDVKKKFDQPKKKASSFCFYFSFCFFLCFAALEGGLWRVSVHSFFYFTEVCCGRKKDPWFIFLFVVNKGGNFFLFRTWIFFCERKKKKNAFPKLDQKIFKFWAGARPLKKNHLVLSSSSGVVFFFLRRRKKTVRAQKQFKKKTLRFPHAHHGNWFFNFFISILPSFTPPPEKQMNDATARFTGSKRTTSISFFLRAVDCISLPSPHTHAHLFWFIFYF